MIKEIMLRSMPARNICGIVTALVPKTMALGGVEIGMLKAKLEQSAAGIATIKGSIPCVSPNFIIIGSATTQRATLLITSVNNKVSAASEKMTI